MKNVCGNCSFVDADRFEGKVICWFDGHTINPDDEGCQHHFFIITWKKLIEDPSLMETAVGQEFAGLMRAASDNGSHG